MSGLDHAMARGRSQSSTALAVLCLLGLAMLALTLLAPMMWQRYGNEGLVPAIMVSGLVAIAATKVSANAPPYWGLIAILTFAVALRIVALVHEPFFSTDIYRYIWDGRVQAAGINPYRYVPADPALAALRDAAIFPHINRADYAPTIYPPVAQMFFLAVTRLGETLTVMRLALIGCEVATVAIMIDLLRRLGLPATAVAAYAWHPLAVWEIANNGHVDSLMVALLMLGIWFFVRARPLASGVAIAVAALVKPYVVLRDGGLSKSDVANLQRRLFLKRGLSLGALTLLTGCDVTDKAPVDGFLRMVSRFNDGVQAALFRPDKLAPTYPESEVPAEFRYNAQYGEDYIPKINPATWRLEVSGLVASKQPWTLDQLKEMPQTSYVARHVCVEGWSMIGKWGGVPLRAFLEKVGADIKAKYVAFKCDDPISYTGIIDMPSAMHAQTILCLTYADKPIEPKFGAPMRLKMTTKLGFKQPKFITSIHVTNEFPGGYWENLGYNWFAGI